MIRANLKGHSGLKGLLLKHGEKIGLAITGIVVAGFIYFSIGKPKLLPDEPQKSADPCQLGEPAYRYPELGSARAHRQEGRRIGSDQR